MSSSPRNNHSSEAINQRGIELADRGWLDEALREFSRAIDLDQCAHFPRINRANVYVEQGRMLEALEDLLAAVRLAPGDPATHYHLGLFLSRYGTELGMRELQATLGLDPDNVDALLQLGAAHSDRGEFTEAEDALDAVLDLDPLDPQANREKGILRMDQGQVHEAIGHLRTAHEQNPHDTEITVDLGLAYLQAGFFEQGARHLQSVVELIPDHLYALYNLAAIHAQADQPDKALGLLHRAVELHGIRVGDWLRDDPMFDKLRQDQRFVDLIEVNAPPPDMG